MKKYIFIFIFFSSWFAAELVQAICPVCTIAVGAGIGLSRWFGIDDTITGLWIGGLVVSLAMWTINWFDKKSIRFRGRKAITILGYYLLVIVPLYFTGIMGHSLNTIWGIDKLFFGVVVGSLSFFLGGVWYYYLKNKNGGRANFPFQKVVMPIAPLVIFSVIFYFITK